MGNTGSEASPGRSAGPGKSSDLGRVREVARRDKDARFTALLHHVSKGRLLKAYESLKKDAAPGVDGVTWAEYGENLLDRLRDLHARVQSGRYRASPSRRVYIPKADGRLRPLGIATLEDKIVQRAVTEVLNAVYEADFKGFSYGFRAGRSQHDALDALFVGLTRGRVNRVLDADIRGFSGHLDREWLMRFLRHRIADERILRLVAKWLNAGVLEDGQLSDSGEGTPQGVPSRRCWRMCTCIMSWTFGLITGGRRKRAAMSLSRGSRMTSSSGLSSRTTLRSSWGSCVAGSRSSPWSCTRRRPG
jgi:RNA-directed DNA polymerase